MGFGQASDQIKFAPKAQLTAIIDDWGPYYVKRVQAALDGTWKSDNTWGGMDTGMVKMAPYTNMPASLQFEATKLATEIESGVFKPFDNATDADLGGMMQYVEGIDAKVPSN